MIFAGAIFSIETGARLYRSPKGTLRLGGKHGVQVQRIIASGNPFELLSHEFSSTDVYPVRYFKAVQPDNLAGTLSTLLRHTGRWLNVISTVSPTDNEQSHKVTMANDKIEMIADYLFSIHLDQSHDILSDRHQTKTFQGVLLSFSGKLADCVTKLKSRKDLDLSRSPFCGIIKSLNDLSNKFKYQI